MCAKRCVLDLLRNELYDGTIINQIASFKLRMIDFIKTNIN